MPLRTETYTFAEEIERLEQRCQEIAEQAVDLEDGNPRKQELLAEGQQLDAQLAGVRWAQTAHEDEVVPTWSDDVSAITLGGLTGGEFGRIEDDLTTSGADVGKGATRVHLAEAGTVDAPYLDSSMGERERISAVAALPLPFLKWAEDRVNHLTGVGEGNGKSFGDMLQDAQATTSTDE